MDYEKRAKRQSYRIIISEIIMVATVVIMVVVLALIVSGYWLSADFTVERQGMLQVNSVPTGASVAVDGDAPWFQRTNTSKVLKSGEHSIVLSRDGYDTWSKTINISEGLLYRLHYPRLFLTEREKSNVYDLSSVTYMTISKEHNRLLLANQTTTWSLINLENETLTAKTLDISNLFSPEDPDTNTASDSDSDPASSSASEQFSGQILDSWWSNDNQHLLIKAKVSNETVWVLLDLNDPAKSVNLNRVFAANFTDMRIFDNSASHLLAVRNGNLHKIDVSGRQISAALASNVLDYNYYASDIIYVTKTGVNLLKNGDNAPLVVQTFGSDLLENASPSKTQAFLSRFYENKFITIVTDDQLFVLNRNEDSVFASENIGFVPDEVQIGQNGEFVFMKLGTNVATFDMEAVKMTSWSLDSDASGWLNSDMIYAVNNGNLIVYDFDGLNRRELSSNASSSSPVTITNDKWLYYVSDKKLVREIVVK